MNDRRMKNVEEEDAWEIYLLLEEMNRFLHQPANYGSSSDVHRWLDDGIFDRLKKAYYEIGGKWFPTDDETGYVIGPGGRLHKDD